MPDIEKAYIYISIFFIGIGYTNELNYISNLGFGLFLGMGVAYWKKSR